MSDTIFNDLPETDEPELTGLRAEDSLLFRADKSSGMIGLATLAEDFFADQIRPEPSGVDLLAVTDAGGATPLLLPVCSPASARPSPRLIKLLAVAAMIMGLATASLAYTVVRGPLPAAAPEELALTRPEPVPVPQPLDTATPVVVPMPTVAVVEPEPAPVPVVEPTPVPEVTVRKPAPRKPVVTRPQPRPAKPSKPAVSADKPCGDEIECLLAGIDDSPPPALIEDPAPEPDLPDNLDTLAISQVMKKAQSRAAGCDDRFGGGGNVKIKLAVDGSGKVTSVKVVSAPNPELGACVADASSAQRFPRTHTGATFTWLFPYR